MYLLESLNLLSWWKHVFSWERPPRCHWSQWQKRRVPPTCASASSACEQARRKAGRSSSFGAKMMCHTSVKHFPIGRIRTTTTHLSTSRHEMAPFFGTYARASNIIPVHLVALELFHAWLDYSAVDTRLHVVCMKFAVQSCRDAWSTCKKYFNLYVDLQKKKEYVRILQTTHGNYRKGYKRYVAAAKDKLAW